jgi:Tol biopolymer transport system component
MVSKRIVVLLSFVVGIACCREVAAQRLQGGMPVVSPDGKRIAFMSTRDGLPGTWVMNSDGTGARRLPLWADSRYGTWAPDSRHLSVYRAEGDSAGIYDVEVESGQYRLLRSEKNVRSVAVSPDGSRIVFSASMPPSISLIAASVDGAERRVLASDGRFFAAAWSPDGRSLVYMKLGDGIWVMNADGTSPRQIATRGSGPVWSPDGKMIAYVETVMAPVKPGEQWAQPRRADIVVVSPDGTGRRILTSQPEDLVVETPSWFPDSRTLAVQLVRDGVTSIHALDLNGKLVKPLPGT